MVLLMLALLTFV